MLAIDEFHHQLLEAERILDTDFSFDLAEPAYVRCLELVNANPAIRADFIYLLTTLFLEGRLSDEPIAFLMHQLRWPEVRNWAQGQLNSMNNPIAHGRRIEKIIDAYSDDWENRQFYKTFGGVKIPFELTRGMVLDSPRLIIPWGVGATHLAAIGSPEVKESSKVTFVTWRGNTVFGGIMADVMFRSDSGKVFWLELRGKERFSSATEAYNYLLPQIESRLGEPHNSDIDGGYPWVRWSYGPIRISLRVAERFVEYVSFMVSNGI